MTTDPTHFEHCLVHEGYWCTCGTWAKYLTANDEAQDAQDRALPAECPGVGEYGHGLTGRTVHWGCCPASRS